MVATYPHVASHQHVKQLVICGVEEGGGVRAPHDRLNGVSGLRFLQNFQILVTQPKPFLEKQCQEKFILRPEDMLGKTRLARVESSFLNNIIK